MLYFIMCDNGISQAAVCCVHCYLFFTMPKKLQLGFIASHFIFLNLVQKFKLKKALPYVKLKLEICHVDVPIL